MQILRRPLGTRRAAVVRFGTIDGPVHVSVVRYRFRGYQVLAGAGLVVAAAVVADAAVSMVDGLIASLIVLVALYLIYRLILGAWLGRLLGGSVRLMRSLVRSVWRAVRRAGRHAVVALRARGVARVGLIEQSLTTHRFRVRQPAGGLHGHVMYGEVRGVPLQSGEMVRVVGGPWWAGRSAVRAVEVLAAPDGPVLRRVTARAPISYLCIRWGSRICFVLAPTIVVWIALSLAGIVR